MLTFALSPYFFGNSCPLDVGVRSFINAIYSSD